MAMAKADKITIRKYNGDDSQSWAVFVNGRVVEELTGLVHREAAYYRDRIRERRANPPTREPQ